MRCSRLYCPDLAVGLVALPKEEAHHAQVSLRLKPGNEVVLFDGVGHEGLGIMAKAGKRDATVEVRSIEHRPFELFHRITLAVAMGRSHRQGYLIEKCTELGVAGILPIIAERSVSKPDAGSVDKWTRRAIEACKQCGRAWLPKIRAPISFADSLDCASSFDQTCLVHPGVSGLGSDEAIPPDMVAGRAFGQVLASLSDAASILVWVGPEGGWSSDERNQAIQAGAILSSLGPHILRIETAAIAVCAAASLNHESRPSAK